MHIKNEETDMDRICSMAGGLGDTVKQLSSLSRLIASVDHTSERATKIGAEDIANSMRIFALHLEAIGDGLHLIQDLADSPQQSPFKDVSK